MSSKQYFCLFCIKDYTNDKQLRQHLIHRHFDDITDHKVNDWIKSLLEYQTDLNKCLSSVPKVLPKTSVDSLSQKLLMGCRLCDRIIDCFKLNLKSNHKYDKDVCICGEGREATKVVVICCQCRQLFHYDCVEPYSYSGEETSLYKCFNCNPKDFEISELKSLSTILQRIHVYNHYKYQPYVCKAVKSQREVCNASYITLNFLKTHLKCEHNINLDINDQKLSEYYGLNEIPKVQQIIDKTLRQILSQPVVQNNQISNSTHKSTHSIKRRVETDRQVMDNKHNKHLKTATDLKQTKHSSPPSLRPVMNSVNRPINAGPAISPPILTNPTVKAKTPNKPKRGRPKKIMKTQDINLINRQMNNPNHFIEENPFKGKRLSEKPRLSRPNISLSREQERALNINGNQNYSKEMSDNSSDSEWDDTIEQIESKTPFSNSNPKPTEVNKVLSNVKKTSDGLRRKSNGSADSNRTERLAPESPIVLSTDEDIDGSLPSVVDSFHSNRRQVLPQMTQNKDIENIGQNNEGLAVILEPKPIFSDWLTHTKPKKSPYFPQIGDEVVYIPYGHRQYIETVRVLKLYPQTNTNKFLKRNDVLNAKVKEIKFEKHLNTRYAKLCLALVDTESDVETKNLFTVKFHDIDNVIDFIVLRQTYELSLISKWNIGDQFRAIVEDKWWFGTVKGYNINDDNTKTQFQALSIIWANGSEEPMSFWDIEKVNVLPKNRRSSLDVSEEDRNQFYRSHPNEWPICGQQQECQRISNGLKQILDLKEAKELMEAFDTSGVEYVNRISYPINLQTIISRLENHFYRRHSAVKYDIKFFESNALLLNCDENSEMVSNSRIVVSVCLQFIDKHNENDIKIVYQRIIDEKRSLDKLKQLSRVKHLNPETRTLRSPVDERMTKHVQNILLPSHSSEVNKQMIDISDNNRIQVIELEEVVNEGEGMGDNAPKLNTHFSASSKSSTDEQLIRSPPRLSPYDILSDSEGQPPSHKRFFCVFCSEKFSEKDEVMHHYCTHLKVRQPNCPLCPQNTKWDSLDQFMSHNPKHIHSIKSFDFKSYSVDKSWVESIIAYNDSIDSVATALKEIDQRFGDYCPVCQRLNVFSEDSQPLYHKSVFTYNRRSVDKKTKIEDQFRAHLTKHLKYEPKYQCILCSYRVSQVSDDCCEHMKSNHKIIIEDKNSAKVYKYFKLSEISLLKNEISNLMQKFANNS